MSGDVSWLTEEQFERIRPLLPNELGRAPRSDDRTVISGILHVIGRGSRRRDAPREIHGPYTTLYNRFAR